MADGGQLEFTNGGSGGTTSPLTTKGDLYGYASTNARIPVGTDGQSVIADSSNTNGVRWQDRSPKNYIINSDAEVDTSGWATYNDGTRNIPVDGTGGTATSLTFSRSTSSPLRGSASFSMAQANSTSIQGKGASYDFTIDSADQAKVLAVQFDFNASSTFVAADGITAPETDALTTTNSGNSDIEVFIYDKTNAALIFTTPMVITANGANNFTFKSTFQTASNSTSYRLIFHVATTSANATGWTFKFDNVFVGPQAVNYGPPVTDWQSYTPTYDAGFGTVTNNVAWYRRNGDSIELMGYGTSGTVAASSAGVSLPSGLTLDTTKISPTNNTAGSAGQCVGSFNAATSSALGGIILAPGTSTTKIYFGQNAASGTSASSNSVSANVMGSNSNFNWYAKVPISGWSSTVQMSNDTDTRVCGAIVKNSANLTVPASGSAFVFDTVSKDTHGAYNASTGVYTVPVSGFYDVGVSNFVLIGAGTEAVAVYRDGSNYSDVFTFGGAGTVGGGCVPVFCNAGDTLMISSTGTGSSLQAGGIAFFFRRSGPSAIAASEPVRAAYHTSISSTPGANVQINFDTKDYDTHGAVTTGAGAWKFTAPKSDYYTVTGLIAGANSSQTAASSLSLYKSGSKYIGGIGQYTNLWTGAIFPVTYTLFLNTGEYIDLRESSGQILGGGTLSSGAGCWVTIRGSP